MEEQLVLQSLSQGVLSSRPPLSVGEGGKMRDSRKKVAIRVVLSVHYIADTLFLLQCFC